MKALVTGPDGLLGSNLVRALLEKGFGVRAFVHPASVSRTLDGLDVERITGDLLDKAALESAAAGVDVVFHCAASTAMWPPRDPNIWKVNVGGTRNVVAACLANGVGRLVHTGSASSFGPGPIDDPGTELSPFTNRKYGLAYFDSKREAQNEILAAASGALDAVVVNPTFMLGPWDSGPSSGAMIARFAEKKFPFYPAGGRNFAHVRDVAAGMVLAAEKGRRGECYILGGTNMTYREFFRIVAEKVDVPAPRIPAPRLLVESIGLAGSAYGALTGKRPLLSREVAINSCNDSYYSAEKAIRELGMPQTPVETAVADSAEWMTANGLMAK